MKRDEIGRKLFVEFITQVVFSENAWGRSQEIDSICVDLMSRPDLLLHNLFLSIYGGSESKVFYLLKAKLKTKQ